MFVQVISVLCIAVALVLSENLLDPACEAALAIPVNASQCCQIPEYTGSEKPRIDKCIELTFGANKPPVFESIEDNAVFSPKLRCFGECLFNVTDPVKDMQGQIDATVKGYFSFYEQKWASVFELSYNTCKEAVAAINFNATRADECSFVPIYYLQCFKTQIHRNCPASNWLNSAGCNALKQAAESCPIFAAAVH